MILATRPSSLSERVPMLTLAIGPYCPEAKGRQADLTGGQLKMDGVYRACDA